ncbi:helix-turn-helix transcriptional regulator [Tenacibaculum halocynthiae]|uniref:helix-turn-helix transcriptional regulator n=1 Tax=Tenacibaculum halocynthiae TaxID=1254437 RepID=UPI003D662014
MLTKVSFYITAIVCLITAFVIKRVYFKEKNKNTDTNSIQGIKWFALAIFSWGVGAFINIILTSVFNISTNHKIIISLGVFFSLVNSLFILMSIPSIEHYEKRSIVIRIIERFTNREVFIIFGGILGMIASVFLISFYSNNNENSSNNVIWLIDIPISLVVAFSLLQELNKAFKNRGMRFMYLPTIALFVLIIIAVTHRIIPETQIQHWIPLSTWNILGIVTALSFKFLFILLFTILLYSWKLLAEKEEQQSEFIKIKTIKETLEKDKETLLIANESHLDTIKHLKSEIDQQKKKYKKLKKSSKVELSDRQKEVLANLGVCGTKKSYTEIAEAMNISVDGFQAHIYQIKKALNISGSDGKEQLISYAIDKNLLGFATISCS